MILMMKGEEITFTDISTDEAEAFDGSPSAPIYCKDHHDYRSNKRPIP
jgi:hypothetical protein